MRAIVLAVALAALAGSMVVWGGAGYAPVGLVVPERSGENTTLQGRLISEDGCLYVLLEDTGERILPVLPAGGTQWDPGKQVLTIREIPFKVGLPIELSVGWTYVADDWRRQYNWVHPPPSSCRPDWAVTSSDPPPDHEWVSGLPSPWYLALTPPALDGSLAGMLIREEGCYYLDADDGTRWQPMFPYGTTTDVANYRLLPHWSLDLVLGHRAELVGGPVEVADHGIIGVDAWASPLNPDCDSSHLWLVISGQSFDTR